MGYPGHPAYPGPYGYSAPRTGPPGSAIALAIVSGLLTLSCYFSLAGLPALVLAIMALVRNDTDPAGAGRLTKIGWIVLGAVSALIVAVLIVIVIGIGLFASQSPPDRSFFDSPGSV